MEVTVSLYCAILLNTNIVLSLFDSASVFVPSRDSAGIPDETSVQFVQMKTFDFVEVFVLMQGFEMNLKHSLISREALELFETENKLLINLHTSYLFNSLSANVSYFIFEGSILPKFDFSLIDHFHVFSIPNYPCIIQVNAHISDSVVSGMKIKVSEGTINSLPGHIIVDVLQILYDSPDRDNFHSVTTTLMSPEWVNPGLYWITHSGGTDFWQANIKGNSKRLYYPNIYYYDETIATGCFRLSFVDDLEDFANKNYLHSVNIISNGNTYVLRNPPSPVASPIFAVICKDNFGLFSTIDSRIWLYPTQFGDYQIITESYFSMHTFPSYLKIFRGNEPKNITDEMIGKGYNYYTGTQTFSDVSSVNFVKFYLNYTDSLYYSITILPEDSSNLNMCLNGYKNERLEISHCNFGSDLKPVEFLIGKEMNITHFEIAGHFEILIQDLDERSYFAFLDNLNLFNSSCSWDDMIDNIDNSLGLDPCDVVDVTDQTSLSMMTLQRIFKLSGSDSFKNITFALPGIAISRRKVWLFHSSFRNGTLVVTSSLGRVQFDLLGNSRIEVVLPCILELYIEPVSGNKDDVFAEWYIGIANDMHIEEEQGYFLGRWFSLVDTWKSFEIAKQTFDAILNISLFDSAAEFSLLSDDIQMTVNISNKPIIQLPDSSIVLLLSHQSRIVSFFAKNFTKKVSYWSLTRLNNESAELKNLAWHMINSLDDLQQKSFYIDEKETFPYVQKLMTSSQTMFKYCDIDKGTSAMKCASLLMVFPETCDITLAGSIRRTGHSILFSSSIPYVAILSKTPCYGVRITTNLIDKDVYFPETKAVRLEEDDTFYDSDFYAMLDLSTVGPTSIYVSNKVERILEIVIDNDIYLVSFQLIQVGCFSDENVSTHGFSCFRHVFESVGKSADKRQVFPIRLSQGLYRLTFSKGVIKNIQLHFYDLDSSYVLPDLKTYCPGGFIYNDSCYAFDGLFTELSIFSTTDITVDEDNNIVMKYIDGTYKQMFTLDLTFDYHLISSTMVDVTLFVDDWSVSFGTDDEIVLITKDGMIRFESLDGNKFSFVMYANEVIEIPSDSIITRVFVQPGNSEYVEDDLTGQLTVPFSRKIISATRCYLDNIAFCADETSVNSLFTYDTFSYVSQNAELEYINLNTRQGTNDTKNKVFEMDSDSILSFNAKYSYLLNSLFIKIDTMDTLLHFYADPTISHVNLYALLPGSLKYSKINLKPLFELKEGAFFIIVRIDQQYFTQNSFYRFVILPNIDELLNFDFSLSSNVLFSLTQEQTSITKYLPLSRNVVYHLTITNVLNLCTIIFDEDITILKDESSFYLYPGRKSIVVEANCKTFATFSFHIFPTTISLSDSDVKNSNQIENFSAAYNISAQMTYLCLKQAQMIFLSRKVDSTSEFVGKHYDSVSYIIPANISFQVTYLNNLKNDIMIILPFVDFKNVTFEYDQEQLLNPVEFLGFLNLQTVLKSNKTTPNCLLKLRQNQHYVFLHSDMLNTIWLLYDGTPINVTIYKEIITPTQTSIVKEITDMSDETTNIHIDSFPYSLRFFDVESLKGQTNYFKGFVSPSISNVFVIQRDLTVFSTNSVGVEAVGLEVSLDLKNSVGQLEHFWLISICNSFIEDNQIHIHVKKSIGDSKGIFQQDTVLLKSDTCINILLDPLHAKFTDFSSVFLYFSADNVTTIRIQSVTDRQLFNDENTHYSLKHQFNQQNFQFFCKFGVEYMEGNCLVSSVTEGFPMLLIFGCVFFCVVIVGIFVYCRFRYKRKDTDNQFWMDMNHKSTFLLETTELNEYDGFSQSNFYEDEPDTDVFLQ
eukprot:TRINITY_DN3110_c0_g1_i3.p1 TRINITY_DN3110_c0_g1~~TRINITY_DN3110_c0_g1_i3.p1  ORF type:complete len:1919 (+),score=404.00 TRINITY_DN3110_c0_g1_i3:351-5759(+)